MDYKWICVYLDCVSIIRMFKIFICMYICSDLLYCVTFCSEQCLTFFILCVSFMLLLVCFFAEFEL